MQNFEFKKTLIEGLFEIQPLCVEDIKGYLIKDYSKEVFLQNNIEHDLKEVFYTNSYKGVIRALHFQREKQQPKLVRCVWGNVFDVVVDLRKDSPTFKKSISFDMSEKNKKEILIPAGCAHGYLVLEHSIMSYKCSEKFYGEYDDGIMWNDPDIGIEWPLEKVNNEIILADKDKNLQSFKEFMTVYGGF